jgi:hypothetical protein
MGRSLVMSRGTQPEVHAGRQTRAPIALGANLAGSAVLAVAEP